MLQKCAKSTTTTEKANTNPQPKLHGSNFNSSDFLVISKRIFQLFPVQLAMGAMTKAQERRTKLKNAMNMIFHLSTTKKLNLKKQKLDSASQN